MNSNPDHGPAAEAAAHWQGRRTLVTGASGFVGANLVRRLLALGANVHILLRHSSPTWRLTDCLQRLTVHTADLADAASLSAAFEQSRPQAIFHLATARGGGASQRLGYINTSILGTAHLIEALRSRAPEARLVAAGSSLEYAPSNGPISEDHPLLPDTLHGAVKASASLLLRHAAQSDGLSISQLRLFHIYGPWESGHRFLPTAIRLGLAGQPIPLAAGQSRRDWVHVDDVVSALLAAAAPQAPAGIFNIGSGIEHGNDAVLDTLEALLQRPLSRLPDAMAARPTDQAHRYADIGLARRQLGWQPRLDLAHGLQDTLAWLHRFPAAWDSEHGAAPLAQ